MFIIIIILETHEWNDIEKVLNMNNNEKEDNTSWCLLWIDDFFFHVKKYTRKIIMGLSVHDKNTMS